MSAFILLTGWKVNINTSWVWLPEPPVGPWVLLSSVLLSLRPPPLLLP